MTGLRSGRFGAGAALAALTALLGCGDGSSAPQPAAASEASAAPKEAPAELADASADVIVQNPLNDAVRDYGVVLPGDAAPSASGVGRFATGDGRVFTAQWDDLDGDGAADGVLVIADLAAGERVSGTLEESDAPTRSGAGLIVREGGAFNADGVYEGGDWMATRGLDIPAAQGQDSGWAKLEGPYWESDLIGYRLYLDDRNLTDVFGKRTRDVALADIEGDYHKIGDWGADVLKVGPSLGLGSPAIAEGKGWRAISPTAARRFDVVADGPLRSILRLSYKGVSTADGDVDVVEDIEIRAGRRWTERRVSFGAPVEAVTGFVRHEAGGDVVEGVESGVFFAFTYGPQADQGDGLGLAVLIPSDYSPQRLVEDAASYAYKTAPIGGPDDHPLVYRFLAGWELGVEPVADAAAFEALVRRAAQEFAATRSAKL